MSDQITQGDIALEPVEAIPKGTVEVPPTERGIVLAYGEATGAAHVMTPGKTVQWDVAGQRYVTVTEPDTIRHDSPTGGHGESTVIPPGTYAVRQAHEFTDEDEFQRIAD